jgi:hypothetical protein
MREKFYGLLREYSAALRECDLSDEKVRLAPEGIEREQVIGKPESARKRCRALRLEIRRYPDINALPRVSALDNPPRRYKAQAA